MDIATRAVVERVPFPARSRPFMNRVAPDGRTVWVQTLGTNMNVVLDVDTMAALASTVVGTDPETCAFQPDGPYVLIAHIQSNALAVLDRATGALVKMIDAGVNQANICFAEDGRTAFVASPSGNAVLIVDMVALEIVDRIPTSAAPMGLILLDPNAP